MYQNIHSSVSRKISTCDGLFGFKFFVLFLFNNYVILKALPISVLKDHAIGKEGYHGGNVCKMDYVIVESSLRSNANIRDP